MAAGAASAAPPPSAPVCYTRPHKHFTTLLHSLRAHESALLLAADAASASAPASAPGSSRASPAARTDDGADSDDSDAAAPLSRSLVQQRVALSQRQQNKFHLAKAAKGFRVLESQLGEDVVDEEHEAFLARVRLRLATVARSSARLAFIREHTRPATSPAAAPAAPALLLNAPPPVPPRQRAAA